MKTEPTGEAEQAKGVVSYSRDYPVAKMVDGVVVDDPERDYWRQRRADEERELMRERDDEMAPYIDGAEDF